MKEVRTWVTDDGKVFDSWKDADDWERNLKLRDLIAEWGINTSAKIAEILGLYYED